MPNITVCPRCGSCYEETSSEEANSPDRCCGSCWRKNTKPEPVTATTELAGRGGQDLVGGDAVHRAPPALTRSEVLLRRLSVS